MPFIDIKTLFFIYIVITALCTAVMVPLWLQNRKRSPEIFLWLIDYIMQFIALILVILRGVIPDLLSIVIANALIIGGIAILYTGLERYTGKTARCLHLYLLIIIFTIVHAYFTFIYPSLSLRNVNLSAALLYLSVKGALHMLKRVDSRWIAVTRGTGAVFILFALVSISHIVFNLLVRQDDNIFRSGLFDAVVILEYMVLFILLTFALFLMVSRRLQNELEAELSGRKKIESELSASREQFKGLVETLHDFVWEVDSEGHYTYVSPQMKKILGYEPDELLGRTPAELMTPDEMQRIWRIFKEKAEEKKPIFALENINIHKDGHLVVLETNGMPYFNESGKLLGYRGSDRDVTARKKAEEALILSEEKFSKSFQTSPDAIIISRKSDGTILEVNDTFTVLTRFARDEVINKSSLDLNIWVHKSDRDEMIGSIGRGQSVRDRDFLFRKKNGEIGTGLLNSMEMDLSGEPCILSSIRDITERKNAEMEMHKQRRFLSDLIELSGTIICVKYTDGSYKLVNRKWEIATGLNRQDVIGRTDEEIFPGETGRQFRLNDLEVIKTGTVMEKEEILDDANGKRYFISIKFPLRSEDGTIEGICAMITEITERKENEEKIRHLATHDPLTDLPTLRLANDRMEMAMSNARRYSNKTAVMFIDLDGFKTVNDTLGHDAGDYVLKEAARRLLSCIRMTDTAARIGGDEFLVISTNLHSADDAVSIAENIIRFLSQPVCIGDREIKISASLGIALYPDHGTGTDQMIKKADEAMYRVKVTGKNNFTFAD